MILQVKGPLSRKSLSDSVYDALLENILSGSLRAGTEVSEVALAEALQVSRTPVHQAVGRLLKDGLLVQEPPRTLVVARFERGDVEEIYEMRRLLEAEASGRAADGMSSDVLRRLRAEADALERDATSDDWPARALDFDQRFHDAVAEASGNRRLRADIARYRLLARAFCRLTGSRENLRDALREHVDILSRLEARDGAGAARLAAAHVEKRFHAVLAQLFPEAT
jgi:DNA-binding GntR family transcriptional regulator